MGLVMAAAAVARSAPQAWAGFMAELLARADNEKTACIMSPPDMLHVRQGRAQFANELALLTANCVREADQLQRQQATLQGSLPRQRTQVNGNSF